MGYGDSSLQSSLAFLESSDKQSQENFFQKMHLFLYRPSLNGEYILSKWLTTIANSNTLKKTSSICLSEKINKFVFGLGAISLGYTSYPVIRYFKKYFPFQDPTAIFWDTLQGVSCGHLVLECHTLVNKANTVYQQMASCQANIKFPQVYLSISPSQSSQKEERNGSWGESGRGDNFLMQSAGAAMSINKVL